jgi:hypothetical protein
MDMRTPKVKAIRVNNKRSLAQDSDVVVVVDVMSFTTTTVCGLAWETGLASAPSSTR